MTFQDRSIWLTTVQLAAAALLFSPASMLTAYANELECPIESIGNFPSGATLVDNELAYVAGDGSFTILDVSDPYLPVELGSTSYSGDARKVSLSENLALVTSANVSASIRIYDVADPGSPEQTATISAQGINGSAVQDGWAYVTSSADNALRVYDLSDPSTPEMVAEVEVSLPYDVAVGGDHAYTVGSVPMTAWDVSDPANPELVETVGGFNGLTTVIHGSRLLAHNISCGGFGCSGAVHIVDLTQPQDPEYLGSTFSVAEASDFAYTGDFILMTSSPLNLPGGLYAFDTSDPDDIGWSHLDIGHTYYVTVAGSVAIVAAKSGTLAIDLTDCLYPADLIFHSDFSQYSDA